MSAADWLLVYWRWMIPGFFIDFMIAHALFWRARRKEANRA